MAEAGKIRPDKGKKNSDKNKKSRKAGNPLPAVIAPTVDAAPVVTGQGRFDLDDPVLPAWVEREAFTSCG